MNTKLLKQKILDLAIHGKLVPQNPEDGDAFSLYKEIQLEKKSLMENNQIKKEKSLPEISESEIPFVIPETWYWCRLGDIVNECFQGINTAGDHVEFVAEKGIPIIQTGDITDGKLNILNTKLMSFSDYDYYKEKYQPRYNDIFYCNIGTIGKPYIYKENYTMLYHWNLFLIRYNYEKLLPVFLKLYLEYFTDYFKNNTSGTAMTFVSKKTLVSTLFPLPPLAEQQRIVEQIEKIFSQIDYIEQNQTDLSTLVKQAKSKILDLAIHGKLVEQNPQEESATVLLEKIRSEKETKIKAGELKRDKKDSHIIMYNGKHCEKFADGSIVDIEDEIPFEIPNNWSWCRLSNLVTRLGDGLHGTPIYDEKGDYYFINGNNLGNGKIIIKESTKKVNKNEFEKYKKELNLDSFMISINGTLGNIGFYNNEKVVLGKSICYFNLIKPDFKKYLYYYMQSKWVSSSMDILSTGSTIKNVSLETMRNMYISIPPIAEQERIVNKIENLFYLLNSIASRLEK